MNQSELKSDLIAWLEQQWDKAVKDSETPDKELLEKYTFYDGLTTAYEFTIARLNSADRRTPRGFAMPWSRMRGLYDIAQPGSPGLRDAGGFTIL